MDTACPDPTLPAADAHRVVAGDCREVLRTLPAGSAGDEATANFAAPLLLTRATVV